jgi:hypothetical protein
MFWEATVSLPVFSTQAELFSTSGLSCNLFASNDRYRLFAQIVYPAVVQAREQLEKCYSVDNGRVAIEPVLMLGLSLLQERGQSIVLTTFRLLEQGFTAMTAQVESRVSSA